MPQPRLVLAPLLLLAAALCPAQTTVQHTHDEAQANAQAIADAEALLDKGDWRAAETTLTPLAAAHPHDARILFDLGFTQERNNEDDRADQSYTAASTANPTFAEPQLSLGLLEARQNHPDSARTHLNAVVALASAAAPLRARALRALARLDAPGNPDRAREELAAALQLTGSEAGDAELTASLSRAAGNATDAEAAYRRALTEAPNDPSAAAGLADLLRRQNRTPEAITLLESALAAHPNDPILTASLASAYAAADRVADALPLLESLHKADPNPAVTRLLAHLYLLAGRPADAEPLYRSLLANSPDTSSDPTLDDDLGSTLIALHRPADAQPLFASAVTHRDRFPTPAAWADTEAHLAFAASRNHQPELCLQALAARATVLPETPATLFLVATAHDSLRQKKEAIRAYHVFLDASHGSLPEEEFQARHRLVALEHEH